MPTYDLNACGELFERWKAAVGAEQERIKNTYDYFKAGSPDKTRLRALQEEMFRAHEQSMALFGELQKYRLD
jgi:hypothetical protein